jgi:hypothetical protein
MVPPDSVPTKRAVKVFMAAPGDLADERRAFKEQIDLLNIGFGDEAGVEFVPLGWEDTLPWKVQRVQAAIDQEIDTCDVFVLALHRHWGWPMPVSAFSSDVKEEFHRALQRSRQSGAPEIFVFFKNVDTTSVADPGPQLTEVLKFRAELEGTRTVRYSTFADPAEFQREVDRHLRTFVQDTFMAVLSALSSERLAIEIARMALADPTRLHVLESPDVLGVREMLKTSRVRQPGTDGTADELAENDSTRFTPNPLWVAWMVSVQGPRLQQIAQELLRPSASDQGSGVPMSLHQVSPVGHSAQRAVEEEVPITRTTQTHRQPTTDVAEAADSATETPARRGRPAGARKKKK